MCVRLYPDIIVAAEISSIKFFENNPSSIFISIGNCLAHQKDYVSFGIPNAFIGFEGEIWNKDDYITYLRSLPQFFTQTYEGYRVNLDALEKNVAPNDILYSQETPDESEGAHYSYDKLFTQGTYPLNVLMALGLAT